MVQKQSAPLVPEEWLWLVEIAVAFVAAVVLSFILKKIVNHLRKRAALKGGTWRTKLDRIIHVPLQLAIWGSAAIYIIDLLTTHFGLEPIAKSFRPLKDVFIVACVTWVVIRGIKEGFTNLADRSSKLGIAPGTIHALNKFSLFFVVVLFLLIVFQIFGLNVLPLLAFGGIGIAGLAFAAQDIIANFFGGMVLHLTQVFSVGDQIVIPGKDNFEGVVKEIGWYITVCEDYSRRPVYFPNALFSKTQVINEARRTHRRVQETIAVRYDDLPLLDSMLKEMREKIAAHPEVDETDSFSITLNKFGEHGLEIYLYFLIHRMSFVRFLEVKEELFKMIQKIIAKHGAELCSPIMSVKVTQV